MELFILPTFRVPFWVSIILLLCSPLFRATYISRALFLHCCNDHALRDSTHLFPFIIGDKSPSELEHHLYQSTQYCYAPHHLFPWYSTLPCCDSYTFQDSIHTYFPSYYHYIRCGKSLFYSISSCTKAFISPLFFQCFKHSCCFRVSGNIDPLS